MIHRELADFLEAGNSILLGTRNERLEPDGARVTAVQVADEGRRLLLFLPKIAASIVLPNLKANGQAAIVFCRVTDDHTYQVKGEFVGTRAARASERAFVTEQWERFIENLEAVGYPRAGTEQWITWPSVTVELRVTALFDQTPGPKAGAAIA